LADVFWSAEICYGIGNAVLTAEAQQRRELFLGQLMHAHRHVVLENEIQKELLLAGEPGMDVKACMLVARLAGDGRRA
jgi:hypothetical protein